MGRAKKLTASILLFITMLFCAFSGCTEAQPVISPVSSNPAASSDALSRALPSASNVEAVSGSPASSAALSYPDYPAQPPRPDKRPRVAYLTFDDGPTEMTPQILDILKQYDVKATFFVVHKNSQKLASYMKRAYDEGHEIAVHSYTHDYKAIYQSADIFLADFQKTREWICAVTGQEEPTLQFRFPGGSSISQKYLKKPVLNEILYRMGQLHAVHHDWNVSSGDATNPPLTRQQVLDNVMKTAGKFNEPVILMHDVVKNTGTRDALPEIITLLRERGYVFDTISNIHQPAQHRVYHNDGTPSQGEPCGPPASTPSVPPASSALPPVSSVLPKPPSSLPSSSAPSLPPSEPSAPSSSSDNSTEPEPPVPPAESSDTATSVPAEPEKTEKG